MPELKNRTTVLGKVCVNVICANLEPERTKDVPFKNQKVKEIDGRSL